MDKPITIKIDEFRNAIAEVVNNSSLPPFIIEYEIERLYREVSSLAQQQKLSEFQKFKESEEITEDGNDNS